MADNVGAIIEDRVGKEFPECCTADHVCLGTALRYFAVGAAMAGAMIATGQLLKVQRDQQEGK